MAEPDAAPAPAEREASFVIVRPYPKIIYLYLTWVVSVLCWLLQPEPVATVQDGAVMIQERSYTLAQIWIFVFTFNLLVISFDFSRIRSVAIAFFIIAFVFAANQFGWLGPIADFIKNLSAVMNKVFYLSIALVFTIIYLLVFLNTRFNYWEIQPNEILHHHGFLGDVYRYPTRGLRMTKEISDVLEYLLLRAGRLILDPAGSPRSIILENVIRLNKTEDKIQRLLGTTKVRVDEGAIGAHDS